MKELKNYYSAVEKLTKEFYKKYYWEEWEDFASDYSYYVDVMSYNGDIWPINISDEYWGINHICIALYNNIPRDIVHRWYSDRLDASLDGEETFINLYNFWKKDECTNRR